MYKIKFLFFSLRKRTISNIFLCPKLEKETQNAGENALSLLHMQVGMTQRYSFGVHQRDLWVFESSRFGSSRFSTPHYTGLTSISKLPPVALYQHSALCLQQHDRQRKHISREFISPVMYHTLIHSKDFQQLQLRYKSVILCIHTDIKNSS